MDTDPKEINKQAPSEYNNIIKSNSLSGEISYSANNHVREGFYKIFRNSSRKAPPPSSYITTEAIDRNMCLIAIYYGESKYYLVFKTVKE